MFSLSSFLKKFWTAPRLIIIFFVLSFSLPANGKCDCSALSGKGYCSPDCFILCSLQGSFQEAQTHICEKKHHKEIQITKTRADIKSLEELFKKSGDKIMAIKSARRAEDPDCKHCLPVAKIQNITRPAKFEKETCPESHIKIYHFQKSIQKKVSKDKQGCLYGNNSQKISEAKVARGKERRKIILDALNKYSQKTLNGDNPEGKKLNEGCPDQCSFYVSSVMTFYEEKCRGKADLYINCNHKRAGSLLFGMDYLVDISYKENLQCEKEAST